MKRTQTLQEIRTMDFENALTLWTEQRLTQANEVGMKMGNSHKRVPHIKLEPLVGFEPTTCSLRMSCSTE